MYMPSPLPNFHCADSSATLERYSVTAASSPPQPAGPLTQPPPTQPTPLLHLCTCMGNTGCTAAAAASAAGQAAHGHVQELADMGSGQPTPQPPGVVAAGAAAAAAGGTAPPGAPATPAVPAVATGQSAGLSGTGGPSSGADSREPGGGDGGTAAAPVVPSLFHRIGGERTVQEVGRLARRGAGRWWCRWRCMPAGRLPQACMPARSCREMTALALRVMHVHQAALGVCSVPQAPSPHVVRGCHTALILLPLKGIVCTRLPVSHMHACMPLSALMCEDIPHGEPTEGGPKKADLGGTPAWAFRPCWQGPRSLCVASCRGVGGGGSPGCACCSSIVRAP